MRSLARFATFLFAAVLPSAPAANAQTYPAGVRLPQVPLSALRPASPEVVDTTTPTIYVVDANSVLWSIDVAKASIHRIGSGTGLTDIAFNPKDHKLYGISFNALYTVSSSTGRDTYGGSSNISDANTLVFDGTGKAYTAGYQNDRTLFAK